MFVCVSSVRADESTDAAERFVEQMRDGQFDKAFDSFDDTMQEAIPAKQLEATWNAVEKSAGAFQKRIASNVEKSGEYTIVRVTCEFAKTKLDVRVTFDADGKIAGLYFTPTKSEVEYKAPDYVDQKAFEEEEITLGADPWKLPATLTMPVGDGPWPAVVLVHGSGPNDRDETIGPNKPFKDLAWGLASRGVAVLRYDKRTKTYGQKLAALDTLTVREETIDDAIAAARELAKRPRIDADRVFVLGHSLGGYLMPRIAEQDEDGEIAGYVILAGNTRPLTALLWEQSNYILGLDGETSDEDNEQLAHIRALIDRVKGDALKDANQSEQLLGAPPAYWLDLRDYAPAQLAAKVIQKPTLILQGERDYQVTLEDFDGWKSALGEKSNFTFKSYPALNHLFIEGTGRGAPSEYQREGHVSREVIEDIQDWIGERKTSE